MPEDVYMVIEKPTSLGAPLHGLFDLFDLFYLPYQGQYLKEGKILFH